MTIQLSKLIDMANEMSDVRIVLRQLFQNLEDKLDSSSYDVDSYNIQSLKKELSGLIDQAGGTINQIDTNMSDAVSKALEDFTSQNFQAEVDSVSQYIFNQKSITHASSTDDLNKLTPWDGRLVYVDSFGLYEYSNTNSKWIRHLIPDAGISINYDYSTQEEFNQAQVGWVDTTDSLANLTELAHRQVYVNGQGHYQYTIDKGWTETPNKDVKFVETVDQLSSLSTWEGRTVNVHNVGNYTFTNSVWTKQTTATNITDASTQDLFNQKGVTTVESVAELNTLDKWSGRTVNVQNVGVFSFDSSSTTWQQLSQKAKIGFDIEEWLKNTTITPDLFLDQAGNDDLKAFYLACDKANSLNLPVTLLPRTYELNDVIDLRKASNGITTSSELFSSTTLKAIANPNNASTFVNFQNIDRRKVCGFRVDANSLYDIALDTSYTLQVGPSLNITFETIWVRGYNKIGWLAENNSDVYFKSCAVFEPGSKSDTTVVTIKCVTIGGPAQFECCNLLGGKLQVAAQHITNIMGVTSGVEFLAGSWNNYAAVGSHHFASLDTNSCFTITGELWGFDVTGGLCEASNNGYLVNGNGGNTITGKLEFNGTKITPNEGSMYLAKGTLGIKYGKLIASFNGGMQNLTGLDSLNIFDDVSLNSTNNTVAAVSKHVTASSGDLRSYHAGYGEFYTDKYAQLGDRGVFYTPSRFYFLQGTGGYYGVATPYSNTIAQGILKVMCSDGKKYAEYRLASAYSADGSSISYSMTELINTSTTNKKLSIYYDAGNIQVILDADSSSDTTIKRIYFSFDGFIGAI